MSNTAAKLEELETGLGFVDEREATRQRRAEASVPSRDANSQQRGVPGAGLLAGDPARQLGLGARIVNAAIVVGVCAWAVVLFSVWGSLGGAGN